MTKLCLKCNTEKSIDNFSKCVSKKDGVQANCKLCISVTHKHNYLNNPKFFRDKSRIYKQLNPSKIKEHEARWRKNNKEKIKERQAKYIKNHPEVHKTWTEANPEKCRLYSFRSKYGQLGEVLMKLYDLKKKN